MRKYKQKNVRNRDAIIKKIKTLLLSLTTGMIGFAAGWLFEGKIVLSFIVFSLFAIAGLVAWIVTTVYEKRVSIVELLNENIDQGKYREAVKLGYSVSRAFFLAGKNMERYRISERVCFALSRISGSITINEKEENTSLLRAKILIDDCGWSLYLVDRFAYKKSAKSKIQEGVGECLRLINTDVDSNRIYSTVFIGIRHLFGMCVENFEIEEKKTLENDNRLTESYLNDIIKYGGILGFLVNDEKIYDPDLISEYYEAFKNISLGAKNASVFFEDLQKWCRESMEKTLFKQSTYNFRTKYHFAIHKALIYNNKHTTNDTLDDAKNAAILMTLGYAKTTGELAFLQQTSTYSRTIDEYCEYIGICPDRERVVKGILLLGKIAMAYDDLQSLEDAKKIFVSTVSLCKEINRTDTYYSAQKNLIAVNERILNKKISLNYLSDIETMDEVHKINSEMEDILKDTKSYLGYVDDEMKNSCRQRKKKYKQMIRRNNNYFK